MLRKPASVRIVFLLLQVKFEVGMCSKQFPNPLPPKKTVTQTTQPKTTQAVQAETSINNTGLTLLGCQNGLQIGEFELPGGLPESNF